MSLTYPCWVEDTECSLQFLETEFIVTSVASIPLAEAEEAEHVHSYFDVQNYRILSSPDAHLDITLVVFLESGMSSHDLALQISSSALDEFLKRIAREGKIGVEKEAEKPGNVNGDAIIGDLVADLPAPETVCGARPYYWSLSCGVFCIFPLVSGIVCTVLLVETYGSGIASLVITPVLAVFTVVSFGAWAPCVFLAIACLLYGLCYEKMDSLIDG